MLGGAQLLADPEYQEKPVVGACAEYEHDQQELRDRRHLEAVPRGLGNQRAGYGERDNGGDDGRHGQRERPEDHQQQPHDEQQGKEQEQESRVAGRLLLIYLGGDGARQMRVQPGGQPGARDLRAQSVHQVGLLVLVAAPLRRKHHQLLRPAVRGPAGVKNPDDAAHRAQPALEGRQSGDIRRGQR